MPMPQVPERIKEAPALALRAVFAGIGQMLLATDKIRSRLLEPGTPLPGPRPEGAPPPAPARPAEDTGPAEGWRSDTGNVRVIGERRRERAEPGPRAAHAAAEVGTGEAGVAGSAAPAAEPPLPNYDELSLPSLRARLRVLDAAQVRALLDYERAHAGRAPVIAMYERRIAKLESPAR